MTTKELLNLPITDVNKMTERELRSAVSQMASAANKALKRMEQSGRAELSIEYQRVMKRNYSTRSGGKFGVEGKNLNQLRNEYVNIRNYMTSKTGTLKEFNKREKEVEKYMGRKFKDVEEARHFWESFNRVKEDSLPLDYNKEFLNTAYEVQGGKQSVEQIIDEANRYFLADDPAEAIAQMDDAGYILGYDYEADSVEDIKQFLLSQNLAFDMSGRLHKITDIDEDLYEILAIKADILNTEEALYHAGSSDKYTPISGSANN